MVRSDENLLEGYRRPPSRCELTWRRIEMVSVLFLIRAPILWVQSLTLMTIQP